jgi:4-alpha-glucanotransferase
MGDIPIYVALDSVDVWVNPELFKLDDDFKPKKVAGVPPDYFCSEGQLWGNPVYDYEEHKKDGYAWWINRIKNLLSIYDYVRIDHFRAFDRYYEVPADAKNAINGEWIKVPSEELFSSLHQRVDKERIVAEDLGIIDDGVRELLKKVGYPGMKILSFAFDGQSNNLYLPQNIEENYICYTGTHDNDTLMGLIENASEWDKNNLKNGVKNSLDLLKIKGEVDSDIALAESMIKLGYSSKARWFIMPMQDINLLSTDYRINEPGIVKEQNWAIKLPESAFSSKIKNKLKSLTKKYNR